MPKSDQSKGVRSEPRKIDWKRIILVIMSIMIIISWILALLVK